MVNKAYIETQPIDRPDRVEGKLTKVEPLIRTIKGKDETKSIRLIIEGDNRGFLIHPPFMPNILLLISQQCSVGYSDQT